jgi:exo-1,4-beta-D-glucosaminidase
VVAIGQLPAGSPVTFLDARLETDGGEPPPPSFYWLPAAADELDWAKSEWFYTPTRRFADLQAVTRLRRRRSR